MSTSTMVCHLLACDRCKREFKDEDESEGRFHAPSIEEIRDWARNHSWVITPKEDVCWHCSEKVAGQMHDFRPGADGFCVWCRGWVDDDAHPDAPLPGQLEIRAGDQS